MTCNHHLYYCTTLPHLFQCDFSTSGLVSIRSIRAKPPSLFPKTFRQNLCFNLHPPIFRFSGLFCLNFGKHEQLHHRARPTLQPIHRLCRPPILSLYRESLSRSNIPAFNTIGLCPIIQTVSHRVSHQSGFSSINPISLPSTHFPSTSSANHGGWETTVVEKQLHCTQTTILHHGCPKTSQQIN